MTCAATSHQGALKMFWPYFREDLTSPIIIPGHWCKEIVLIYNIYIYVSYDMTQMVKIEIPCISGNICKTTLFFLCFLVDKKLPLLCHTVFIIQQFMAMIIQLVY